MVTMIPGWTRTPLTNWSQGSCLDWPVTSSTNQLETVGPVRILKLLAGFARQEPVVYLHPNFGRFFERFTDRPNGLVHYLEEEKTKDDEPRALANGSGERADGGLVKTNEQIWQKRWNDTLQKMVSDSKLKDGPPWAAPLLKSLHLSREQNITVSFLGSVYAKSLNYWGVQTQRLGRSTDAGVWFGRAVDLNPRNHPDHLVARDNGRREKRFERVFRQIAEVLKPRIVVGFPRNRQQPAFPRHPAGEALIQL